MKITILGSGTCVPSLTRSSCSVLVRTGQSNLLLDCGAETLRNLLEGGLEIGELTHLLFSHLHPDHTAGFVPFLFATKYPGRMARLSPFTVIAGKGFARFYKNLQKAYGHWIVLKPGLMEVVEMDVMGPDQRTFADFTLFTMPMEHSEQSVGFRINAGGKSVVYSGDTDVCPGLVELSRGADLLICESAMPDGLKAPGHLTPSQAGEMAARAGVKRLVLTHFYPECEAVDMAAQCRKTWGGPLDLAQDLMEIYV